MYKVKKDFRPNTKKLYEDFHGVTVPDGYAVHHVLPVRLGGSHHVDNLEVLSDEDHIAAHLALYVEFGDVRDLCASYMLRGLPQEARKLAAAKGGRAGWVVNKAIGRVTGFGAASEERRREVSAVAGHIGGTKQRDLGIGIHAGEEKRAEWASMGGKASCEVNGWKDPSVQSENGKRGGPKNKGFKWYHDGVSQLKYTAAQQLEEPFEAFLERNKFNSGRTNK